MARILITGAAGYVGSALVHQLLSSGEAVTGLDCLNFGAESLLGVLPHPQFRLEIGDLRDPEAVERALDDVDRVVHLAGIVGDPACAKDPALSEAVNWVASKRLLDTCVRSGKVERFVFASTCSNYGKMGDNEWVNETSALNPVSLYAELKVRFEQYLLENAGKIVAVPLRFATAYGLSPRPRFDLTVNEFVREIVMGRELKIFGEQFWRPYCHVYDLARACAIVLKAPEKKVNGRVFGVGATDENYQKKTLAELLQKRYPNAIVSYVHKAEDPRDYRVNFSRITEELGFQITKTVPDGIDEYAWAIENRVIPNPDSPRYRNI